MSEEEAALHTELLLPLRPDEPAPLSDEAPPLSGQLFFTRLLHEDGADAALALPPPLLAAGVGEGPSAAKAGPETADETGLGDGAEAADSGSYPGASLRSNFPSAPIR